MFALIQRLSCNQIIIRASNPFPLTYMLEKIRDINKMYIKKKAHEPNNRHLGTKRLRKIYKQFLGVNQAWRGSRTNV